MALFAGALVFFHVFLLWRRIADASILAPRVLLNWLGAVVLLAVLFWLRRRGHSAFRGRGALVFWLLVLLLHAGPDLQPAPGLPLSGAESLPAPSSILAAALWAAVFALAAFSVATNARARAPKSRLPDCVATATGFGRVVAPRPPPRSLAF